MVSYKTLAPIAVIILLSFMFLLRDASMLTIFRVSSWTANVRAEDSSVVSEEDEWWQSSSSSKADSANTASKEWWHSSSSIATLDDGRSKTTATGGSLSELELAWSQVFEDTPIPNVKRTERLQNLYAQGQTAFVSTPKGYQYLLQKPFYVYEQLIWFDATIQDVKDFRLRKVNKATNPTVEIVDLLLANFTDKHAEDLWLMASSLSHPMRTFDPNEAKIFIVPALGSQAVSQNNKYCWQGVCGFKLLNVVEQFLQNSPWFQRNNGNDHLFVSTDYMAPRIMHRFPTLQKCHMIGIENRDYNNDDRFTMPSHYMGTPCPPVADENNEKTGDFVMVATLHADKKAPSFQGRRNICHWMESKRPQYKMPVCGRGKQCPALAKTKFGFHVRGDSFGANRLIDTLLSRTVPVFTQPQLYMTLPDWIDWDQISVFASIKNTESFLRDIDSLVNNTALYEQKLAAVKDNKDLFEWRSGIPFDTYMFMLLWHLEESSRKVTPKVPSSSFSALRLPTEPFKAFQNSSKFLWCGPGGFAKTCSQCGKSPRVCLASCKFCAKLRKCVSVSQSCKG